MLGTHLGILFVARQIFRRFLAGLNLSKPQLIRLGWALGCPPYRASLPIRTSYSTRMGCLQTRIFTRQHEAQWCYGRRLTMCKSRMLVVAEGHLVTRTDRCHLTSDVPGCIPVAVYLCGVCPLEHASSPGPAAAWKGVEPAV